jgi:hypothetical protein
MKTAANLNEIATLSTVLLSNLDEVVFFSKLSGFVQQLTGEHKVLGFEAPIMILILFFGFTIEVLEILLSLVFTCFTIFLFDFFCGS